MEIEFALTLEDKLRFGDYLAERSPSIRRARSMYTALSCVFSVAIGVVMYGVIGDAWVLWMFGAMAVATLWYCPRHWTRVMRERTRKLYTEGSHPPMPEHCTMRAESDGLHISSDKADSVVKWSAVEQVVSTDSDLYLFTSAVNAIPVPRRAFQNPADFEQFADQIRAMREQAAGLTFLP